MLLLPLLKVWEGEFTFCHSKTFLLSKEGSMWTIYYKFVMKIQLHKAKTIWSILFSPNYEGFKFQPEWIVLFPTQTYFLDNSWKSDTWTLLFMGALLSFRTSLHLRVHWNTWLFGAGNVKLCICVFYAFIIECIWILHLTSVSNT